MILTIDILYGRVKTAQSNSHGRKQLKNKEPGYHSL